MNLNLVLRRFASPICIFATIFAQVAFAQEFTHGTAIVIFRITDTIYVAADSKVQSENPLLSFTGCKIRTVGDIGIALAGLYSEQTSKLDAIQIAIAAARTEGTIFQKMEALEKSIREPLISAWSNIQARYPSRSLSDFRSQIAFFGFYDGVAFVLRDRFYPVANPLGVRNIQIMRTIVPSSSSRETTHLVYLAQTKEIDDALKAAPFSADNWTEALNKIIQFAIDKRQDVGAPIDILMITKNGKKWIQKKEECPD